MSFCSFRPIPNISVGVVGSDPDGQSVKVDGVMICGVELIQIPGSHLRNSHLSRLNFPRT